MAKIWGSLFGVLLLSFLVYSTIDQMIARSSAKTSILKCPALLLQNGTTFPRRRAELVLQDFLDLSWCTEHIDFPFGKFPSQLLPKHVCSLQTPAFAGKRFFTKPNFSPQYYSRSIIQVSDWLTVSPSFHLSQNGMLKHLHGPPWCIVIESWLLRSALLAK